MFLLPSEVQQQEAMGKRFLILSRLMAKAVFHRHFCSNLQANVVNSVSKLPHTVFPMIIGLSLDSSKPPLRTLGMLDCSQDSFTEYK